MIQRSYVRRSQQFAVNSMAGFELACKQARPLRWRAFEDRDLVTSFERKMFITGAKNSSFLVPPKLLNKYSKKECS